ncbi:MAG: hypothetical protein PUF50_04455 [Erysipelotrichaceae bacterium]|nr:hypothetical protein [Erysipelotrichaceae bacterium]
MAKYLYVDDYRMPPKCADAVAKDYDSAIQLLKFLTFEIIDLDYSLNDINGNGLKILEFMVKNNIKVKEIRVHSDHEIGKPRMLEYIEDHKEQLITE